MKFVFGLIIGVLIALGALFFLPNQNSAPEVKNTSVVKAQPKKEQPSLKEPLDILGALDKYIELNPQDSNAYLQKADYLAKTGRLKEALPFYDKALYYNPNNAQAYMNRGAVNYMLGDYENAKKDLSAAINLDASKGENFFNRALANYNLGSYPQAKTDFKQAALLFNKAADKKSFEQARQGYKASSAMAEQIRNSNLPNAPVKQGVPNLPRQQKTKTDIKTSSGEDLTAQYTSQLMTSLSNTENMLEKFKEARKRAGNEKGVMPDFESYAASMRAQAGEKFKQETAKKTFLDYKDEAYKKQAAGDIEGALKAIDKAIELNPKEADLYQQRAKLNMAAKDPNAAISDYKKALSLNPKDGDSLYNMALAKDMIGDKKGARQDMHQAEEVYKEQGNKEGLKQATEMENLWEGKQISSPRQDKDFVEGANAFNSGKYQEALKNWDNLIKKYPEEASAYYNRAITNARLNDISAAEKDYRQAIKLNPNMAEALDGLSGILVSQGKDAREYIDKSLEINPENASAYNMRALDNMNNKNNPKAALNDFDKALSYDDKNAMAYYYRGYLKASANNNIQAGMADLTLAQKYAEQQGNQQLAKAAAEYLQYLENSLK